MTGKDRKTLDKVTKTPSPQELYSKLMASKGWEYKTDAEYYLCRDRALCSVLYNGELRISEAIRTTLGQYEDAPNVLFIRNVLLSKTRGRTVHRDVTLAKTGDRAPFTNLVLEYLGEMRKRDLKDTDRPFPWSLRVREFPVKVNGVAQLYRWKNSSRTTPLISRQTVGTNRAWSIVRALMPDLTEHWLRVYGEKYLYKTLNKDIIAVSKIVKVDARTAIRYLTAGEEEYPVV